MTTLSITLALNVTAITLYTIAALYLASQMMKQQKAHQGLLLSFTCLALLAHGGGTYHILFTEQGLQLGFFKVGSLIFWVINLIVLISGLRKPLQSLYLLLFPLSALTVIMGQFAAADNDGVLVLSMSLIHI